MKRYDIILLVIANVCATVLTTLILDFIYKNRKQQ